MSYLIKAELKEIIDLVTNEVTNLKQKKKNLIIAIDGRCASGKTTLAQELQRKLAGNVIHLDDFFLPFEKRVNDYFKLSDGNIDYERFEKEVINCLKRKQNFSYQPFNCQSQTFNEPVSFLASELTIIEGTYSTHPCLKKYYDLCLFLSTTPNKQLERISKRNNICQLAEFKNKWIVMEEQYFSTYQIQEKSDLVYET